MITLLTGENTFEIQQALRGIAAKFNGAVEKLDGSELAVHQLPDLLMGTSLFNEKRVVIIKSLSENKTLWESFGDWLGRLSDDVQLVLVEPKPDKRTKTYKVLQKAADVKEFKPWGERDQRLAEAWMREEAKRQGIELSSSLAQHLVARTGVDQWRIFHALEKLAVLETITPEAIDDIVEPNPTENVFQLFETALSANTGRLRQMIATLAQTEDPYKVFGLLTSQVLQLAALASTSKSVNEVAKDIGAHPFVLSKLAPQAKRLGAARAKDLVAMAARLDGELKTTSTDSWILVERLLMEASRAATS